MALALSILWILAAFLAMWGLSLMWRGLFPRGRDKAQQRQLSCPSCGAPVDGLICNACGFEGQTPEDFLRPRDWRLVLFGWVPVAGGVGCAYGAERVRGWFQDSLVDGSIGLGPAQGMALGVALFAAVLMVWSYRGDRSRGRRRCPKCWYDMSASKLVCPECGHDAKLVKRLYRPRRRMGGVLGALALMVMSYGVWVTPRVVAGGAVGAVPSWVLIAGFPWLPESMMIRGGGVGPSSDWTLQGRCQSGKLWQIEAWWLKRRVRSLIVGGTSVVVVRRAMPLLTVRDHELGAPIHLAVVQGLSSSRAADRAAAAATFAWLQIDERARRALEPWTEGLFKAMDDPSPAVSALAAWYLAEMNADPERLVGRVFESIRTSSMNPRIFQGSLYSMAMKSDRQAAVILEASRDPNAGVRIASATCLAQLGSKDGVRRLVELLQDTDPTVAQAAADAMAARGDDPDVVVPAIISWWLARTDKRLRFPLEIYHYGERLGPHMPAIAKLLEADHVTGLALTDWIMRSSRAVDFGPVVPVLKSIVDGVSQLEADGAKRLLDVTEASKK
jgi:hypothetical protein